jgi:hypothetical protein
MRASLGVPGTVLVVSHCVAGHIVTLRIDDCRWFMPRCALFRCRTIRDDARLQLVDTWTAAAVCGRGGYARWQCLLCGKGSEQHVRWWLEGCSTGCFVRRCGHQVTVPRASARDLVFVTYCDRLPPLKAVSRISNGPGSPCLCCAPTSLLAQCGGCAQAAVEASPSVSRSRLDTGRVRAGDRWVARAVPSERCSTCIQNCRWTPTLS